MFSKEEGITVMVFDHLLPENMAQGQEVECDEGRSGISSSPTSWPSRALGLQAQHDHHEKP
jgi:hypothetical protein